jgi:hypothetical protein
MARDSEKKHRSGTVDLFKRADGSVYYRGRIRLGDGSLHRLTIEEPFCNVEADARKYTATIQAEEDAHRRILAAKRGETVPLTVPTETAREWQTRWLASRVARGHTSTRDDKSRYQTHVDPIIGGKVMASVTRADVEAVVERLDGKVRAGDLSWHTAWNVWDIVSKMFCDASMASRLTCVCATPTRAPTSPRLTVACDARSSFSTRPSCPRSWPAGKWTSSGAG